VTHRPNAFAAFAFLAFAALAASNAAAQSWPDRPIQMVVPFGPGGTTDLMARLLQEEMGKALGASVVVVNTAGAGGAIAMAQVARAKPDGYTISMTAVGPQVIQPARRNTGYTPESFDYLCSTYDVPVLTFVAADSPHKDFKSLAAWAKANPGKMNYGSPAIGSVPHLSMIELVNALQIDALHVPYKSSADMIVPLKTGQLVAFNDTPSVGTQYQLRAVLALADAPVPGYESVPIAKSLGLAVRASVWGGLVAPKGLPAEVRSKLEAACEKVASTTLYKARAQVAHNPLVYRNGEQFRRFALAEHEKFARAVRANQLDEK
jgi:tripartite-type tricarboxylate transporter receptor subunit TctC